MGCFKKDSEQEYVPFSSINLFICGNMSSLTYFFPLPGSINLIQILSPQTANNFGLFFTSRFVFLLDKVFRVQCFMSS